MKGVFNEPLVALVECCQTALSRIQPAAHLFVVCPGAGCDVCASRSWRCHKPDSLAGLEAGLLRKSSAAVSQRGIQHTAARAPLDGNRACAAQAPFVGGGRTPGFFGRWNQDSKGRTKNAGRQETSSGIRKQHQARIHIRPLLPGCGIGGSRGQRLFRPPACRRHSRGGRVQQS